MSGRSDGRLRLVCASANPDKVAEIAAILTELAPDLELTPRPAGLGDVVEDAPDLAGNARLKAVAVCEASGRPAVADDTGLEVDALGGAPGVFSARYSMTAENHEPTYEDNVAKLLAELDSVGATERQARRARFRTVAMAVWPDGSEVVAEGEVTGWIADGPRGSNGFGYDPVFVPEEGDGRTFAEMTAAEKHSLSHRRRAFVALVDGLAG